MTYARLELSSLTELQIGDVFRISEGAGLHFNLVEYEVVGKPTLTETPHPKFPELILRDVKFKAKNRRNGKGKTCNYRDSAFNVWRKS